MAISGSTNRRKRTSISNSWRDAYGWRHRIDSIEDGYLVNIVRFIQRRVVLDHITSCALNNSAPVLEAATVEALLKSKYPAWSALKAEMQKRGLNGEMVAKTSNSRGDV
jgi:hypothetical protein